MTRKSKRFCALVDFLSAYLPAWQAARDATATRKFNELLEEVPVFGPVEYINARNDLEDRTGPIVIADLTCTHQLREEWTELEAFSKYSGPHAMSDKSKLPSGPWDDEPNWDTFIHANFRCVMNRHAYLGQWSAYVSVPPGHIWHDGNPNASVHGGITYDELEPPWPIDCYLRIETKDHRWIGFDCGHGHDLIPYLHHVTGEGLANYRNYKYVRAEVCALAEQAYNNSWVPVNGVTPMLFGRRIRYD